MQRLWIERKREQAIEAVPDEMVLGTNLIGTVDMVRDRIRSYRVAGVDTLRIAPAGSTVREQLDCLEQALELVRQVGAE